MKKFVFLSVFLGAIQFASAQTVVQWVGQFPKEQAAAAVDLFNAKYAAKAGFTVEYQYDDAVVAELLSGSVKPEFDLVHMKDADMLNTLAKKSLSSAIVLENKNILPGHLKDPNNQWVGVLKRARILYYNSDLVSAKDIPTYESLGDIKFQDKLCLRQKKAQYNVGLYAYFVGVWGPEKTKTVLDTWAENSAALPTLEKDLDHVIANIANGTCTVGVANTYYYVRHLKADPNTKVKAVFPNQDDIGAHVNVDGVAVLNAGAHKAQAQVFANWLLTEPAQLALSEVTGKFPANPVVVSPELQKIFGSFKENESFHLNEITDYKDAAAEIATEVGLK